MTEYTGIFTKFWKVVTSQWDKKGKRSNCRRRWSRSWFCLIWWFNCGAQTKDTHLLNNLWAWEQPGVETENGQPAGGRQQLEAQLRMEFLREGWIQRDMSWRRVVYLRERDETLTEGRLRYKRLIEGILGRKDLHGKWFIGLDTTGMAIGR